MDTDEETNLLGFMHLHLSGFALAPFCIDEYTILFCLGGETVVSGRDFAMRHGCNGTHGSLGHDYVTCYEFTHLLCSDMETLERHGMKGRSRGDNQTVIARL